MSAPAAKAFSLPVTTMQPIAGSASNANSAADNSFASAPFNALSRCGRFKRITPTLANAQLPSGQRQLGQTVIEPGYDDRTGNLIYIMTPIGAPFPAHANKHAISPLYLIIYPHSAAASVGTMSCAHEGGDNCADHGPSFSDLAQDDEPGAYGTGV